MTDGKCPVEIIVTPPWLRTMAMYSRDIFSLVLNITAWVKWRGSGKRERVEGGRGEGGREGGREVG